MKVYKVSELNFAIKQLIEPEFSRIQVKGEVTNLREQASGHIYFSLKDNQSQINAVLFQGIAKSIKRKPKPGDQITISGELSIYAPRGSYQIIVREVDYDGIGDLLLKLHQLKTDLEKKGYFDKAHKKPLPSFPKKIGVITSPTGSVIQDILHVLSRRYKGFKLLLNPVKVQGDGAAEDIAKAIEQMNHFNLVDVIIIGRGGGSLEDLWAFNEKIVADSIFNSKIPIISAVGHETDFSISDYVADYRAPTPSAAAEIVVQESKALMKSLSDIAKSIERNISHVIKQHQLRLQKYTSHPLLRSFDGILLPKFQMLDEIKEKIDSSIKFSIQQRRQALGYQNQLLKNASPDKKINQLRTEIGKISSYLDQKMKQIMSTKKEKLNSLFELLTSKNPKNILQKGYCIPFRENSSSVIMSGFEAKQEKNISLLFHDEMVHTKITDKVENEQKNI